MRVNANTFIFFIACLLVACGEEIIPITISDIPVYPGATTLGPNDTFLADTLATNVEQDKQLREQLGLGGSVEQIAYRLPSNASWDAVERFYLRELDGWNRGLGGSRDEFVSHTMDNINRSNDLFQTTTWSRPRYSLTVVRIVIPEKDGDAFLILSLVTD